MELDFTGLDKIASEPAKTKISAPLDSKGDNYTPDPQKPATEPYKSFHSHILDREKLERENMRKAYHTYQENIRRAGSLRSEILKSMKRGEDPLNILLTAVECISLMTGDSVMYDQCKKDATAIYGWGLGRIAPLQEDLQKTRYRLERLEHALTLKGADHEAGMRIQRAIREHKELIRNLEEAIATRESA